MNSGILFPKVIPPVLSFLKTERASQCLRSEGPAEYCVAFPSLILSATLLVSLSFSLPPSSASLQISPMLLLKLNIVREMFSSRFWSLTPRRASHCDSPSLSHILSLGHNTDSCLLLHSINIFCRIFSKVVYRYQSISLKCSHKDAPVAAFVHNAARAAGKRGKMGVGTFMTLFYVNGKH